VRHTICCFAIALCAVASPAFGQDEGGGFSGGRGGSGLPTDINLPRTIPQQFAIKLKIDRTQQSDVDAILAAAAVESAQPTKEMLVARQRLLNATRASQADEARAAVEAYAVAAAKAAKVEAGAFTKVYALLKPNQQKAAPEAFALVAGLFANVLTPGAGGPGGAGGRGGIGGRGGAFPFSRFELLVQYFKLEGDKKKAVKTTVDEAHKAAAPVRSGLLAAHAALGTAAAAAASPEQIDQAAKAYGDQAAAMARLELETLSTVIGIADPELQNRDGIQAAFSMVRGMLLRSKWDEIPNPNLPSY
jgi:hypothetical protein